MNKALFLDRDGVINVDRGYVATVDDFEFVDGIIRVLRSFQEQSYLLIIVTNQSGIGRRYYTENRFQTLTNWMLGQFEAAGIHIDGVYHCPHSPEAACACRKPAPGMLLQAIREHDIDPACSWMIGDKPSDMEAAEKAGVLRRVMLGGASSEYTTHMISTINELLEL